MSVKPRGEGVLDISVSRRGRDGGKAAAADSVEETPIEQLFRRLGSGGRMQVWRDREGEAPAYAASIPIDDELVNQVEERIAKLAGGGSYILKAFGPDPEKGGKERCLGSVTIRIDEAAFPPRQTAREKERDGEKIDPAVAAQQVLPMAKVLELLEKAREAGRAEGSGRQDILAGLMQLSYQQANAERQRSHELTLAMLGQKPAVATPVTAGLSELRNTLGLVKELGWSPAGGGVDRSNMSALERIMEAPLTHMADKVGGRLVDKMLPEEAPAAAPAAAAAPAMPPRPPGVVELPPGARRLTAEELERMRKKAPADAPAAPAAPAPRSRDVVEDKK